MRILHNRLVFSNNLHNAFTDLILFQDKYYLAFRTGKKHMSNGGKLRVFQSDNTKRWEEMPFQNIKGDVRDCKFAVVSGLLFIYFPVRNKSSVSTYTSALVNGKWDYPILDKKDWVACRPKQIGSQVVLPYYHYVHSNFDENGWALSFTLDNYYYIIHVGDKINETELIPLKDRIIVISRTENNFSMIGCINLPNKKINWRQSSFILHAPCAKEINGKWVVVARDARSCQTFLDPDLLRKNQCWTEAIRMYELDTITTGLEHKLNLFRGVKVDCGYCGIAEDKKDKRNCYISYYRGTGDKADIYIAKVRV